VTANEEKVLGALTQHHRPVAEIAAEAGVAVGSCKTILDRLVADGRAIHDTEQLVRTHFGHRERSTYRLPTPTTTRERWREFGRMIESGEITDEMWAAAELAIRERRPAP
jgi:hypothetical protein